MRICKQCIQPDTRPNIYFNDEGICGACLWEEEIKSIDWNSRRKELQGIADWAKNNTKSNYDCVIGVSGGKDSTLQAIVARDELGLRPLLINAEPEGITDIGKYNIENLKQTFSYLNCALQEQTMNRVEWRLLESQERKWDDEQTLIVTIDLIFDEGHGVLPTGGHIPTRMVKHILFSKDNIYKCFDFENIRPTKGWEEHEVTHKH